MWCCKTVSALQPFQIAPVLKQDVSQLRINVVRDEIFEPDDVAKAVLNAMVRVVEADVKATESKAAVSKATDKASVKATESDDGPIDFHGLVLN